MKVFKFGGASISSVDKIEKTAEIIRNYEQEELLIVVSAIGKTTNALEKVAETFFKGNKDEALKLFQVVKDLHNQFVKYLLVKTALSTEVKLNDFYTEVEWLLHDKPVRGFDYYYDQIVCIGELLSTTILSAYLKETGIENTWLDVRDILRTDNHFREANIDFDATHESILQIISPLLEQKKKIVLQGFIGSTDDNESTTLGREGSDYSAAVFCNLLNGDSLTIWKDVPGILSADPKRISDAKMLPELDYDEVVEMAYYGAQVIHPKTIKPLQNKNIPLYVKSFEDLSIKGTIIHSKHVKSLPPIIVIKESQIILNIITRDFSFFGEENIARLYHILDELNLSPNLIQTGAIHVNLCLDDKTDKIESLAVQTSGMFDVEIERGFTLITIRHWDDSTKEKMLNGKKLRLVQQTPKTLQAVYC